MTEAGLFSNADPGWTPTWSRDCRESVCRAAHRSTRIADAHARVPCVSRNVQREDGIECVDVLMETAVTLKGDRRETKDLVTDWLRMGESWLDPDNGVCELSHLVLAPRHCAVGSGCCLANCGMAATSAPIVPPNYLSQFRVNGMLRRRENDDLILSPYRNMTRVAVAVSR
jgi:hypothetical protein